MNQTKSFVVFSLFLAFQFSFLILIVSGKETVRNETTTKERKWLTQLFSDAERNFDMDPKVSSECLEDFNRYKMNLNAQIGWAIRMLESSEWPSVGLLAGTTTHLGSYDECLLVSTTIRGKYCLVEGSFGYDKIMNNSALEAVEWPSDELTVWEILRMFEKNPVRAERKKIQWALCIPSSCSHEDLELTLKNVMYPLFENQDLDFQLKVDQSSCQVKAKTKYPAAFYCAVMFFLLIIIMVCFSTVYEALKKPEKSIENKESENLMTSFSLIRNLQQLFHFTENKEFGYVHALKMISLSIIIYGHRRLYSLGYPNLNPERTEINFKKAINYVELIHLTFVDVFFMMTGFLTFHLELSAMSKHGLRYWFVAILHRWMRLIPAFGAVLVFLIYIFPHISDGPLWDEKVSREIGHCKASWWASMLAINNIVRTEDQCLVVSWYMSADMQISLVGFGLLYITTRSKLWGWICVISTYLLGAFVTFAVAYAYKFHGVLPIYISFLQNPNACENFTNYYIGSYTRIGPYLIGAMAALITQSLKEKNFKFTNIQKIVGITLIFLIGEGYQHLGFEIEYEFGRPFNAFHHAAFAATYRSMFVLPYALMLCIYVNSGFGMFTRLYENRTICVIGRLTYSVFLVNTIVQFLHAASQRSALPGSILINRFWWTASDEAFSYFLGIGMYLLLEAPIANVSKLIKQKLLKKSTDSTLPTISKEPSLPFEFQKKMMQQ